MKQRGPASHRKLCLFWIALLLGAIGLTLLSLGYQTPAQALRESERLHALRPTKIMLQGVDDPHKGGAATAWILSANEDAILFGYYQTGISGYYRRIFTIALDYDDAVPYCAGVYGVYNDSDGPHIHLFGAVTDPAVTELHITIDTDRRHFDLYEPTTYTLYTRDMVYQNGIYYFVLPLPSWNSYYISKVSLIDRDNTRQDYPLAKPEIFSPEFEAALQNP